MQKGQGPVIIPAASTLAYENSAIRLDLLDTLSPQSPTDVYFRNASFGVITTSRGEIYKSADGGTNWALKYTNPTLDQPLLRLLFTDDNVGYAVGGTTSCGGTGCVPIGGIVLKTIDGGNTWTSVLRVPGAIINSIAANDLGEIFITSNSTNGQILKSANAGITWNRVGSDAEVLDKITFDGAYGYCTSLRGKLLRSENNGNKWATVATLGTEYLNDIRFVKGNGFCVSGFHRVYKTTDNGVTWVLKTSTMYSALSLHPLTTSNCLVFGAAQYKGSGGYGFYDAALKQTTDGGDNWAENELIKIGSITCASFYTTTEGYAVSSNRLIRVLVK